MLETPSLVFPSFFPQLTINSNSFFLEPDLPYENSLASEEKKVTKETKKQKLTISVFLLHIFELIITINLFRNVLKKFAFIKKLLFDI
jgi:hypothetical protein